MKGGVGTWAARRGDIVVGALVVLNSVGDILDRTGAIVAGARGPDGRFAGASSTSPRAAPRSAAPTRRSRWWRPTPRSIARRSRAWPMRRESAGRPAALVGGSRSGAAVDERRAIAAAPRRAADLRLLPDAWVRGEPAAITTAAVAPLLREPRIATDRVSEVLHGERLVLLERREGGWLRVRAPDGYHGWLPAGYVATGSDDWAEDWTARGTARALRAELKFEDRRFRLAVGARVVLRRDGVVETADGCAWSVVAGVVRPELQYRAEARMFAAPEWALRWFSGAPYLWGGRTEWGVDCSGLVQATYAARGVTLPRDSDQQALAGHAVAIDAAGAGYSAGDVLCFADGRRISHVALWAGAGHIVHSALSRGGVALDDLFADTPAAQRLRGLLVAVRRPETSRS